MGGTVGPQSGRPRQRPKQTALIGLHHFENLENAKNLKNAKNIKKLKNASYRVVTVFDRIFSNVRPYNSMTAGKHDSRS
jgi:hypothetical protein